MKKKKILKILLLCALGVLLIIFILEKNPLGMTNFYHRFKGSLDTERGKECTTEYVREKYGFEPEIVYAHPVMDHWLGELFYWEKYSGKVFCSCRANEKSFNTIVRIKDGAGCDNYQRDEIDERIESEVSALGKHLEIYYVCYNSDLYVTDSEIWTHEQAIEGYSSKFTETVYSSDIDFKQFLKDHNFEMDLYSDIDLEDIDYEAVNRIFPENSITYYKDFPKNERWKNFTEQQVFRRNDIRIRTYAPKKIGPVEVSADDGSDFTVEEGLIQEGEWEGNPKINFNPLESPVYTCRFENYKNVEFGLWRYWKEDEADIPEGVTDYMFYQYRDKDGKIKSDRLSPGGGELIYTDMLTLMYEKQEEKLQEGN